MIFGMSQDIQAIFGLGSGSKKKTSDELLKLEKNAYEKAFGQDDYSKANYTAWYDHLKELKDYAKDKKIDSEFNIISNFSDSLINTRKILWNKYKGNVSQSDMEQITAIISPISHKNSTAPLDNLIASSKDPVIQQAAKHLKDVAQGAVFIFIQWCEDCPSRFH